MRDKEGRMDDGRICRKDVFIEPLPKSFSSFEGLDRLGPCHLHGR